MGEQQDRLMMPMKEQGFCPRRLAEGSAADDQACRRDHGAQQQQMSRIILQKRNALVATDEESVAALLAIKDGRGLCGDCAARTPSSTDCFSRGFDRCRRYGSDR